MAIWGASGAGVRVSHAPSAAAAITPASRAAASPMKIT
jgi:hypothetical protein